MTTSNRGWLLLALALVVATAGCADGNIDDPDGPSSVLEIVNLNSADVTCGQQGICADDDNLTCSSNAACVVGDIDFGPCIVEQVPDIEPWQGTAANIPISALGVTEPFNNITLDGVQITYNWVSPCSTPTRFVGIGTTVPADATAGFEFTPLTQPDLLNACILGNSADLTLTFMASTPTESFTKTIHRQLNVEFCGG